MKRRKFIAATGLSAFSLSTIGTIIKNKEGKFVGDCETSNDILGPFYRADAPLISDLTYEGLEGTRIHLDGTVYGPDCTTPMTGAMVEIWHCDSEGVYDNDSPDFRQRGRILSDENGQYSFTTILPGKYQNGKLYRPAHIHYRVSERNSKELISQIYFQGDPHIVKDPWASKKKAEQRILSIFPKDIDGSLNVKFDIYLSAK